MKRWTIRRHPGFGGLDEEFSVLEGGEIVGAFDRRFYAELTMAARILLEELAEAERVPVETLVRDILARAGKKEEGDGRREETEGRG